MAARNKAQQRLRVAGLVTGLAGIAGFTIYRLVNDPAGAWSINAIVPIALFAIPLIIAVFMAWKFLLYGGSIVILISLFWVFVYLAMKQPIPQEELRMSVEALVPWVIPGIVPVSALPIISGVLFILAWRVGSLKYY